MVTTPVRILGAGTSRLNWTIYSVQNVTGLTVDFGPCTQSYLAEASAYPQNPPIFVSPPTFVLSLPNATTDLGEPSSLPMQPSVHFFNGLDPSLDNYTAQEGGVTYNPYSVYIEDCAGNHSYPIYPVGPLRVPVTVPVFEDNRTMDATGFLSWTAEFGNQPAAYEMNMSLGLWTEISVGAPFASPPPSSSPPPAGLLSFAYTSSVPPCQ